MAPHTRSEAAQMMAVVSWMILPGLADLMRRDRITSQGTIAIRKRRRKCCGARWGSSGRQQSFLGQLCRAVDGKQPPAPTGGGGAGKAAATPIINGHLEPIGGGRIPINEGPTASSRLRLKLDAEGEGKDDPVNKVQDIKKFVTEYPPLREGEARPTTQGMPRVVFTGRMARYTGGGGEEMNRVGSLGPTQCSLTRTCSQRW